MTAPAYSTFAARFPELVASPNTPDATTQTWIEARITAAWDGMAVSVWRVAADREEGALLQAAHQLVMRRRAAASLAAGLEMPGSPLTSRSEGEWSKSYASPPVLPQGDAHFGQTYYGQQWVALRDEIAQVYGGRVSL